MRLQRAVPPTAEPTDIPPTETPVPTATIAPTAIVAPTATIAPTPTEQVWVNTDVMRLTDGVTTFTLKQGEAATFSVTYDVTTPRTSTTIYAELVGKVDGWTLASPELGDTDPGATTAAWTQTTTIEPSASFAMKVTVTAPKTVSADHNVTLRLWSTAEGTKGQETGVSRSDVSPVTITAIAPPNTDTIIQDGPAELALLPGETVSANFNYSVTTARYSTVLYASLVDENGNVAEGWTIVAEGATTASWTDNSAVTRGSSFSFTYEIASPENVRVPHDVHLVIRSEVATVTDVTSAVEDEIVALLSVAATPAKPSVSCDSSDAGFTCTLNADREDVESGVLTITGAPGWTFAANGVDVPETGVDLDSLSADGTLPGSVYILAVAPDVCTYPAVTGQPSAKVSIDYTYTNVPDARAESTVTLASPTSEAVAPSVEIAPLDFGTLTWDGTSWGTAQASTTATISRDGCGDQGTFDVQIQVFSGTPGLRPTLTDASSSNAYITTVEVSGDPNSGPVTIARVPGGFSGTAQVQLDFVLTPDDDAPVGEQTMTIEVTTVAGQ